MGIREEIEWKAAHCVLENGRDQEIFDKTIKDVLSLLDEHLGECVAETEIDFEGEIGLVRWDAENYCHLIYRFKGKPGDRIAIYRVRGEK